MAHKIEADVHALRALLLQRRDEIDRLLAPWQPRIVVGNETGNLRATFSEALDRLFGPAFAFEKGHYGSWIPGIALPVLLTARRRLTVDLTSSYLEERRHFYGLSERSLIEFAKAGMLFFNIRDFDHLDIGDQNDRTLEALAPRRKFLERIFDEVPHAVYFLSQLRDRLFDAIPAPMGAKPIRGLQKEALDHLGRSFGAIGEFAKSNRAYFQASFRGEAPHERAMAWHWAYLQRLRPVLQQLAPDLLASLQSQYDAIQPGGESRTVALSILRFARSLRYAHLLFSAPLSASFGGVYNVQIDDEVKFMRRAEISEYGLNEVSEFDLIRDDFVDFIYYLQVGRLHPSFAGLVTDRQWSVIRSLGITRNFRLISVSHHDHYDDDQNIHELIEYFFDADGTQVSLDNLDRRIIDILKRDETLDIKEIIDIAQVYNNVRASRATSLEACTEGYQTMSIATQELLGKHDTVVTTSDARMNYALFRQMMNRKGAEYSNVASMIGSESDARRTFYHIFTSDPLSRG